MDRWIGKVVVVTGASFGIGEAIVRTLAKNGLIVVGLARNIAKLNEIASTSKGTIFMMECDMRNEEKILEVFRKIEEKFGGVDVMINNAGFLDFSSMIAGSTEVWKQIIDTNVIGLSICTREALKTMRTRGDDGYLIHINSVGGHRINPGFTGSIGMYPASKFSVTALAQIHRTELRNAGSKIRVTSLSPGLVHTQMGVNAAAEVFKQDIKYYENDQIPNGYLDPQDLADSIVAIMSLNPRVEVQEFIVQSNSRIK